MTKATILADHEQRATKALADFGLMRYHPGVDFRILVAEFNAGIDQRQAELRAALKELARQRRLTRPI